MDASYDSESQILVVRFLEGWGSGRVHEFFDVSPQCFEEMQASPSPKNYFNTQIWNRNEHNTHWGSLSALLAYMEECMCFEVPQMTVHSRSCDGNTPLHIACVWGDIGAIDLLIDGGADINAKGDEECTPIYEAVSFNRARSVERLLSAGATVDDGNRIGFTAREIVLRNKQPSILSLFERLRLRHEETRGMTGWGDR